MKCVKISRPGLSDRQFYIQPLELIHHAVQGEFDGAEVGEKLLLELIEMSEEDFEGLPEFDGW